jgi:hypothetical protein
VIRRAAALLLAAALVAACAEPQWTYEKKGMTALRLDQDLASCRREATDPRTVAVSASGRVDRAALSRCMERKGYTVRRAE